MRTPFPADGGAIPGGRRGSAAPVFDGLTSLFLRMSAVAFVGERGVAGAAAVCGRRGRSRVCGCGGGGGFGGGALRCTGCSLQLTEDWVVVGEEVAKEAVAVLFVHREGCFLLRTEDARGEGVGEGRDVGFVGRGKLNEPAEVCGYGI